MLRAMDSAVAGLRAHQNKLDVIGNNIANVNTFGFKAQTYSFKDAMYQTSSTSSGGKQEATGNATIGGANPAQYGYGSLTGSIATDYTSSAPSYVGGFNASINGSGFFVTSASNKSIELDPANTKTTTAEMKKNNFAYTRVGQFSVDANGYIVDANHNFVYGFQPDSLTEPTKYGDGGKKLVPLRAPAADNAGTVTLTGTPVFTGFAAQLKSVEIGEDGIVKGIIDNKTPGVGGAAAQVTSVSVVLGKVAVATFQNQEGLTKAGNNTFNAGVGDNTGYISATMPGEGSTPTLMAGYLEASNVDLAKEFSDMITAQRGFQANSKIITVSDEVLQELVNMKR